MYESGKLVSGACSLPDSDVTAIIQANNTHDANGNLLCSVRPLVDWKRAGSGVHNFSDALTHPMSEPTFGTLDRAQKYFEALQKRDNSQIGLWFTDDTGIQALARPLAFGVNYGYGNVVNGYVDYYYIGRFVGGWLAPQAMQKFPFIPEEKRRIYRRLKLR
jgi:hypothetical protein